LVCKPAMTPAGLRDVTIYGYPMSIWIISTFRR
jgi:hypothetical protein